MRRSRAELARIRGEESTTATSGGSSGTTGGAEPGYNDCPNGDDDCDGGVYHSGSAADRSARLRARRMTTDPTDERHHAGGLSIGGMNTGCRLPCDPDAMEDPCPEGQTSEIGSDSGDESTGEEPEPKHGCACRAARPGSAEQSLVCMSFSAVWLLVGGSRRSKAPSCD